MSTGTQAPGGQESTSDPQQAAQRVAENAQQKAEEAAGAAKRTVRDQLEQRSSQAADQLGQQASDLRAVGDSLREQGKDGPAKAADQLAGYAERVGGYLHDKDSDALLHDAEDFARRQPWAVGAGALALGFAASRFLKASSQERYASRSTSAPTPPAAPGNGAALTPRPGL